MVKPEKEYKIYNDKEYKRIMELKKQNQFHQMMEACRSYLEHYPYDNVLANMYAAYLINTNQLEEAENILDLFAPNKDTIETVFANHYDLQMKLLGYRHQYEACYQLLIEHQDILKSWVKDYYFRLVYLQKQLGLEIETPLGENYYTYAMKQAVSYDEQLALEHISKHTGFEEPDTFNTVFVDSFDINEWFYKLKDMIAINNYPFYNSGIFQNVYYFKYDSCGRYYNFNKKIDNFMVYTLQDTNQIITMYPGDSFFQYEAIDINPEIDYEKEKVKRISQIDKFNKKYKKYIK